MRCRQAERPLQQDLARRRAEEVRAPNDLGDALPGVVHDHGQVISEEAVPAPDDEVAGLPAAVLAAGTLERIFEFDRRLACLDQEAKRMRAAAGLRNAPAGTRVDRFQRGIRGLCGGQGRAAAAAWITATDSLELVQGLAVVIGLSGLEMNTSIPFETERLQASLESTRPGPGRQRSRSRSSIRSSQRPPWLRALR